ncbi:Hypothetical predicted protein [Paramuricea clavata]|uniref:Uncharacterized protein n=1 Tax=Paramuricea clavata TaxID=317549 RepID=A0A6S7JPB2_PARCT|nr:Hypothetical predicted protein [Paramuricea clavata]
MSALFADDTKVYRTIISVSDCDQLQQALTNLDVWSSDNNIKFNALKYKVLSVTRKKTPISYVYCLGSEQLPKVEEEKDLGVTLSSKLLRDSQVNELISKGNKLLGLPKRTCLSLTDTKVRRTLYLSIVKSKLCYATQVWSPFPNMELSEKIESVQRRATKWILKTKTGEMSCTQRLLTLELLPLCYDREVKYLVFFFKALYGYINLDIYDYLSFVDHGCTRLAQSDL